MTRPKRLLSQDIEAPHTAKKKSTGLRSYARILTFL